MRIQNFESTIPLSLFIPHILVHALLNVNQIWFPILTGLISVCWLIYFDNNQKLQRVLLPIFSVYPAYLYYIGLGINWTILLLISSLSIYSWVSSWRSLLFFSISGSILICYHFFSIHNILDSEISIAIAFMVSQLFLYFFNIKTKKYNQILALKKELIDNYILAENRNLHIAQKISEGNYDEIKFEDSDALAEAILSIKEHLVTSFEKEKEDRYFNEGIAKAAEILQDSTDLEKTFDRFLSFAVKYLDANQGALFTVDEDDEGICIKLSSCYAYDRKRYINKILRPRQGLNGQAFLEKEMIYLKNVPQNYVQITSGLGEATPDELLIVPCLFENETVGIIELASFNEFTPLKRKFAQKLSESIAFTIYNLTTSKKMADLLQQSQLLMEDARAKEEELHQNLEELAATQEEMKRRQIETESVKNMMDLIINLVPFPIFVKDHEYKYILINQAEAHLYNTTAEEMMGWTDAHFIQDEDELAGIRNSDDEALLLQKEVQLPEQSISFPNGSKRTLKTIKVPFLNPITQQTNILGVSIDLTEMRKAEKELKKVREELKKMHQANSNFRIEEIKS